MTILEAHVSMASFIPEQTIVINGLSKSHAMTGWRLGFIFCPGCVDGPTHQEPSVFGNGCWNHGRTSIKSAAISVALTEGRDDDV